jgi:DNA-binding transcriptional regulator YiaG
MSKQPVTRKVAMYGGVKGSAGARTHSGFNTKGVAGIGGGNSTEPEKVSNCYDTLCHTTEGDGLSTANFEEESVHPVEEGHLVSGRHQESVEETPEPARRVVSDKHSVSDQHSLKEALQGIGMSLKAFAAAADTPLDTVKGWSSGKTRTPGVAMAMVRLLAQMR